MNIKSRWYLNKSPLGDAYRQFSNVAKQKTVLDPKTKELIRLSIASVLRCNHCTEHHINDAINAGATKEEISEALLLSSLQSASTQLNWSRELFEKYLGD
ncbi:MAG: carboxymuconolactone decarboxylase family protein [Bacteroidales bacterium]|jgi:AhpD family alkylhydroperoxidase